MNKRIIFFRTTLALFLIAINATMMVSADRITIEKPFKPVIIAEDQIELPTTPYRTDPLEVRCHLEEGRKYHIFLVGDWVANTSETDYDIMVYNSQEVLISGHTESAGIPEQVANDDAHQYFVPPTSDTYSFYIHNDPKDSLDAEAAVFMIIEHIEMNKRYELYLEGRPTPADPYPTRYDWGYEFSTPAEDFQLHIDVPNPDPEKGITGLDMYEARVYPMANPSAEIGYNIWDLGVPYGDFLQGNTTDQYGGYNTEIDGMVFPELRASCEYIGEDMDVVFGQPYHNETELVLDSKDVFYYMTMLAEYLQGTISFYIKTDYRDINVTIIDEPEVGYTDEEQYIVAELESATPIYDAWLDYSTDGWDTIERVELLEVDGRYECWLPRFELKEEVEYKVYAEDEIDNTGETSSSFTVYDPVDLRIETEKLKVFGGAAMTLSGEGVPESLLKLVITHEGNSNNMTIATDENGEWQSSYKPQNEGEYEAYTVFEGDETHWKKTSRTVSFLMEKRAPVISYVMSPTPAKKNRELEISGVLTPPISGTIIKVLIVTDSTTLEEQTVTNIDGRFELIVTPEEEGVWQILPSIEETGYISASQGELKGIEVVEMTNLEKVTVQVTKFTRMPLILMPIGVGVTSIILVEMKTRFIRSLLGKKPKEKEEKKSKGATSYRRRSDR